MCFCGKHIDDLINAERKALLHDALFCEWFDNGTKKFINLDKSNIKPLLNNDIISCVNITHDNNTEQKLYSNSSYINSKNNIFEVARNPIRKLYFDIDVASKVVDKNKVYLDNGLDDGDLWDIIDTIKNTLRTNCGISDESKLECLVFNKMTQKYYENIDEAEFIGIKSVHLIFPHLSINNIHNLNLTKELNSNTEALVKLNAKQHIKKAKHKLLDEKVYNSTNQQFCLPFNTKPSQSEYFYPYYNFSNITIDDYEKYMITNIENTTLIFYEVEKQEHIEANKNRKNIYNDTSIKKVEVMQIDNLINTLIQELPNSLYQSNLRWRLLLKYLIKNNYCNDDIIRFMEHSASKIDRTYTSTEINEYIETMKNDTTLIKYNSIMENIGLNDKVCFLVSKLNYDLVNWFYTKTNTDLSNNELKNNLIKAELNNANIKNPKNTINWKTYTIHFKTGVILDITNKKFYNYTYDTTTNTNEYDAKAKEALNMEQLKEKIIKLYKKNENNYEAKSFVAVKAKWGSGKTKHIVNSLIQYEIDKEVASQNEYSDDDELQDTTINNNIHDENTNIHESIISTQDRIGESYIKILMITNSNNLNTENITKLRKSFPSLRIVSHLDKANFVSDNINILVCSLDSIKKAIYENNRFHYNLIILDEYESIMSYLTENSNYKHAYTSAEEVYDRFSALLKDADKIVALDADLSIQRLSIVSSITGLSPIYYLSNVNNFKEYKYKLHYKIDNFESILRYGLEANKKIAIMSSTKKSLDTIKNIIETKQPHKKYLIINNEDYTINNLNRKLTKADFIKNIETEIKNIDVLMYSPTITIGVSVEAHYFNILLCVAYDKNVPNARVFIQMIYRLRNLIDKEVHIFPHAQLYYKPLNNNEYDKQVALTYRYNIQQLTKKKHNNINETYERLRSYNEVENIYSNRHFNEELLTKLKQHELEIEFIYDNCKNEWSLFNYEAKQDALYELSKTKLISYEESVALKALELKSHEDILAKDKYEMSKIVPSRVYDVITDREYYNDTRQYQEIHEKNKSVYRKEFIEGDVRITETLVQFKNEYYKEKAYYYHETLTASTITNEENKELKLTKDTNIKLNRQYVLDILERFGANKYNNFYSEYDYNEWRDIILLNKEFIINNLGKYIASITSSKLNQISSIDDDSVINYCNSELQKLNKETILEVANTKHKRIFNAFWEDGKESKIKWEKLNAYEYKPQKTYYKNKNGESKNKWIKTISLYDNRFKYNWLNNTIKTNNNWIHTNTIINTDWNNEIINMDYNDYSVKFMKANNNNKDHKYNMYINGVLIKQVVLQSKEQRYFNIDGVDCETKKMFSNTILDTRKINIWDYEMVKKIVNKKTKKTEFVFNEPSKTLKLICSNSTFINMNNTDREYDTIKTHFRRTCNKEIQSIFGLLYCNPIAVNPFNYDYDVVVNKLVSNIQLTTIITKKYNNSNKTFTSNEYNDMRMKLKLSETDYDKLNNKYTDKCNGMNYNTHKKIAEKSSIIKTDLIRDLVWDIVNNSISVVCNEPIQVIEPMPTGLKLNATFYYKELVANVSNTIKHIFSVSNDTEWVVVKHSKLVSNRPIGFNGVIRNGTMVVDYSSITRGDKLILCYDFKKANGLFEVSFEVA